MVGKKKSAAAQEPGMLNKNRSAGSEATSGRFVASSASTRTRKWWLRNWRLRYKMGAVLLVPTLAALAVGGIRVYDGLSTAESLNTVVSEVELAQATSNVIHEVQRERDMAVVRLANKSGLGPADYNAQSARVDQAVTSLQAMEGQVAGFEPGVRDAYEAADNRLASLGALRGIINGGFTESQALVSYNAVLDALLGVNERVGISAASTNIAENAHVAEAVGEAKEQLARMRAVMLGASVRGSFLAGEAESVRTADARLDAAYAEFEQVATRDQRSLYSARVAGSAVDATERMKQSALLAASDNRDLAISPQEWGSESATHADLMRSVEDDLYRDVHDGAAEAANSAQWAAVRDAVIVLVLLVLAFGVAAYIARSMLRPLRTLRYGALEIAQESLPVAINQVNDNPSSANLISVPPVPIHTSEEIGQVARSFDAVHQQALRLASEQAMLRNNVNDLFVNLARRSQTLVQRQLSLIDRLEQDEQDPDQLSSLFELDHLATRMRRNNENLLILGGTDLTRRMMRPVPLSEVVGAAVSEVEQYARIAISDSPELAIQGRVVNDFVHLVAELLENATVFSNPDTEVNVRTAYRRQELLVEIRDRGVGIDSAEIDEINDRLTKPPEVDVAVSRRMGLYVVGQLARRHNIRVLLQNNSDLEGGVTATVHLSGEHVSQLTPDGPIPMPDMHRVAAEDPRDRDALSETGNQLGLAAAFGRGGSDRPAEPPTERAPLPQLSTNGFDSGPSSLDLRDELNSYSEYGDSYSDEARPRQAASEQPADDVGEPATNYSVHVASGDSYGVSDIPRWQQESEPEPASEQWPGITRSALDEEDPEGHDGQCGVPPGVDEPADLFHSPYEAEKTTTLEPVSEFGWKDEVHEPESALPQPTSTADAGDASWKGAAEEMDDAPTQRLPIYEAVLSQWFRESAEATGSGGVAEDATRSSPGTGPSATPAPNGKPEVAAGAFEGWQPAGNTGPTASTPSGETVGDTNLPRRTRRQRAEPAPDEEPLAGPAPSVPTAPEEPEPGWGSADVGWQAAEALVEQTKQAQETTSAGLPKRVPKSNLVPGSAAPKATSQAAAKPAPPRSADAVRGRMSNFQRGVHRGRHAKSEPVSTEPPRSNPSRHEEQE